ncbi:MAG TPA: L,D-transpeptidase [Solirubrobacteraceae bacterium]|nr:L,D-transpeptidase [Solirubrobacteraceae bacterium]
MRRRLLLLICAALTVAAATCAPALAAAPAAATPHLYVRGAYFVHRDAVTVPGRAFSVQGIVRPYVPGQRVAVVTTLGRRRIKRDLLRVKPLPGGRAGAFTERVRSPAAGLVRITVIHHRSAQMVGFEKSRAVAVLTPSAGYGQSGTFVALIQQLLLARHVYLLPTGVFDQHTALALDAYHRLLGRGVSQALDPGVITALLNGEGTFKVLHPRDGTHVEGNLGRQLLALIHGAKVVWIYPISSGKPSTPTILGHFHVYLRTPGYLPDGMYFSDFFSGGYAIHGYDPAPDYPASHGCMRVPIADAVSIYDWLRIGDVVDVYYP